MTGDKEAGRLAAREVRKAIYSARTLHYDDIKTIINGASEEYRNIHDEFRQENFVMAISVMYFLHDREQEPDFLFPWLFHLLRHKNGNIRHAAVRMLCHELGPLTAHIRFPGWRSDIRELSQGKADQVLFDLYVGLNHTVNQFWKPAYKKYKYVESLPSGSYKSIQMVLACLEEDCGKDYVERMRKLA